MEQFKAESFGFGQTAVPLNEYDANDVSRKFGGGGNIEANLWLPFAAQKYKTSPKLEDYVLIPVPAMFTCIPNTNGDSVTTHEFMEFNPEVGMQSFKTFRGKPTFLEHDNKDYTKAKGVILDVFLRPIRKFGEGKFYKLVLLLAYDRTKDPILVNSILTGENNSYSVGFYYKAYTCSICRKTVGSGPKDKPCTHTLPRKGTYRMEDGKLCYRHCHDVVGFECSQVANPAYISAISPILMDPSNL